VPAGGRLYIFQSLARSRIVPAKLHQVREDIPIYSQQLISQWPSPRGCQQQACPPPSTIHTQTHYNLLPVLMISQQTHWIYNYRWKNLRTHHTWNADRLTLARYMVATVVNLIKYAANYNALTPETPAFMRTIYRSMLQLIFFHLMSCLIQDQTTQVTFYSCSIITGKELRISAGENNDTLRSGTGELNLLARFF